MASLLTSKRIFLISPPRSGHEMTVKFLDEIFDPLPYCQFYKCQRIDDVENRCQAKNWPLEAKLGCRAGHMVQKNHDFGLEVPISDAFKYVVTTRHPLYSLTSWHRFWHRSNGTEETDLRQFMLDKAAYWRHFVLKWLDAAKADNVYLTSYEQLIRQPSAVRGVAKFMNDGIAPMGASRIDEDYLIKHVRPQRSLEQEDRYDPELYDEVQNLIGIDLLERCGLKKI